MYERIKFLYEQGRVNEKGLDVAISKGWITEEEKQTIMNGKTK